MQRTQTEAVTFLSSKESNRNLYAISGLDYVAQEDILPYVTSTRERKPLRHELFDKFLVYTGNAEIPFKPTETLYTWQEKNHPWLELAEVHRQITQNIRVTAIPFYVSFGKFWKAIFLVDFICDGVGFTGFIATAMESSNNLTDNFNHFAFLSLHRWALDIHQRIQSIG